MRHAANTHAVDLSRGGIVCSTKYTDVVAVAAGYPYVSCVRCWRRLSDAGVAMEDEVVRRSLPKVYLITGLRVVRDGRPQGGRRDR